MDSINRSIDTKNRGSNKKRGPGGIDDISRSSFPFEEEASHFEEGSEYNIDQFQTKESFYNNLEGSISLVEKTAVKLLPIYREILRKISTIEKGAKHQGNIDDELYDKSDIESNRIQSKSAKKSVGKDKKNL